MKKRYLFLMFALQALYAYFAWPNNTFLEPTWFSLLSFLLCMAPFMFLTLRYHGRKAFLWCGLSGLAIMMPVAFFLTQMEYFPAIAWMIYGLLGVVLFLMYGLTGWLASWITQRYRWAFILVMPALLVTQEFVRISLSQSLWFSPPPSIFFAIPMAGILPLVQMASITGIYGPAFLGLLASAAGVLVIYDKLLGWEKARVWLGLRPKVQPLTSDERHKAMRLGLGLTALMALLVLFGNLDAGRAAAQQAQSDTMIKPAFLQTNHDVSMEKRWDRGTEYRVTRMLREMALEAASQKADVLVLTENAVPGFLPESVNLWYDLKSIFEEVHMPAMLGLLSISDDHRNYNVWYYVDQNGHVLNYYIKRYLTPFGEYMPMRGLMTMLSDGYHRLTHRGMDLRALSSPREDIYDLNRGQEEKLFNMAGVKVSPKVCAEVFYSTYFREAAKKGAEMFFCPSANNWFRKPTDYYLHVINARFRAIETRRWVAKNASMGGTVVIDALGLVRKSTPYLTKSVLVTDMPAMRGTSVYVRLGDVFAWLCLIIVVLFSALTAWHWFRAKPSA